MSKANDYTHAWPMGGVFHEGIIRDALACLLFGARAARRLSIYRVLHRPEPVPDGLGGQPARRPRGHGGAGRRGTTPKAGDTAQGPAAHPHRTHGNPRNRPRALRKGLPGAGVLMESSADITTAHVIRYNGVLYDITRIDNFEGRKEDLKLYCAQRARQNL